MSQRRIGIVSLSHESNTFAPGETTLADFELGGILRGREIVERHRGGNGLIAGALEVFERAGATPVPLVAAGATPGGVVAAGALDALWGMVAEQLDAAGPLDGVLAHAHGAAVSRRHPDMDGWWLGRLRERVGAGVPIVGPIDPHCHLTRAMLDAADVLLPYKTNPHLDAKPRGIKAAELLLRMLEGAARPVAAFCAPPMLINIEKQHTESPPLSPFYDRCRAAEAEPGILDVSVVLGFPYGDVAEMGSGVQVIADGDVALAQRTALRLGRELWDAREQFLPSLVSPERAVERAAGAERPVCLLDMGDNVGGGGTGEGTWLLEVLLRRGDLRSFTCVYDPDAAERAIAAGVGNRVELDLGGKLIPDRNGRPVRFTGTVRSLPPPDFEDRQVRHGGKGRYIIGRSAWLEADDGRTFVLVTSVRCSPNSPELVRNCGVEPTDFDVVCAKGVNAPLGAFTGLCGTFIKVNTPGVTSADPSHFTFRNRRQPLYPFERSFEFDWAGTLV